MSEVTRKRVAILAAAMVGAARPQLMWRGDRFGSPAVERHRHPDRPQLGVKPT